ncbi:hypothetical protein DUNSADRAFT_8313 [Dunaliella salina]|uniref:F-box domain-containing protein n=1 Tax=Dunaliella salina TaxID=3046 RepID=A0ABQ7H5W7_DUNSA|nr:hypothetical protein DUNSADRAFT_8313 [Dunaliella salina]|eukprot:KAF5842250.1 hypothetical protein DUNSADRAFT_8313 [Dunaliella salina]
MPHRLKPRTAPETQPAGQPTQLSVFDLLPNDTLEIIKDLLGNPADWHCLRGVCRSMRAAPCLQPTGIVVDFARESWTSFDPKASKIFPNAMESLAAWPTHIPLKLTVTATQTLKFPSFITCTLKLFNQAAQNEGAANAMSAVRHLKIQAHNPLPNGWGLGAGGDLRERHDNKFGKQSGNQFTDILSDLCPDLERLTFDNVWVDLRHFAGLSALEHLHTLDLFGGGGVRIGGRAPLVDNEASLSPPASFAKLKNFEVIHCLKASALQIRWLSSLPNLHDLYVDSLDIRSLMHTLDATSQHPSIYVHIGKISIAVVSDADVHALDVEVLSSRLQNAHEERLVWSGTVILHTDSGWPPPTVQRLRDIFTALPVRKVVLSHLSYFFLSKPQAQELVLAAPHVVELELRADVRFRAGWMLDVQALKCMLENWPISLLTFVLPSSVRSWWNLVTAVEAMEKSGELNPRVRLTVRIDEY